MEPSRLDRYLTKHNITNEDFASALRTRGVKATEGWISKIRNGKAASRKLARAIEAETMGAVPALCVLGLDEPVDDNAPDSEAA